MIAPSLRLPAAAACLAVLVFGGSLTRAVEVRIDAVSQSSPTIPEFGPPFPAGNAPPTDASVQLAVRLNPFHPERRRGGVFRLSEGETPSATPHRVVELRAAPVTLLGTAVSEQGGEFVVCRAGHESPRIVRPSDMCGDLSLETVEQGRASFRDPSGELIILEVPKAGNK